MRPWDSSLLALLPRHGHRQDLGWTIATATRLCAIIDEAHKRELRVNAHVFYLADLNGLVNAGVDGLAHLARDFELDDEAVAVSCVRAQFRRTAPVPRRAGAGRRG